MSRSVGTMEVLWSSHILVLLLSVDTALCHTGSTGLSCVNDFVSKVSCTWTGPPTPPGANCSISSVMRVMKHRGTFSEIFGSCKLEQHGNSPPGCSFAFAGAVFRRGRNPLPYIRLECDGTLVENITNYEPKRHVKMNPPGAPNVSSTTNETLISWTAGSPKSMYIKVYDFQVQAKQKSQMWEKALRLATEHLQKKIPSLELQGPCEVRVRVRVSTSDLPDSHWSEWSPVTSWISEEHGVSEQLWNPTRSVTVGVMLILGLIVVVMLTLNKCCINKWLHKEKPVPNPSKYFHTLHSVHGGNLKKWLNPLSAPESFFTAQPCDHISSVELCDSAGVLPSTCGLLHCSKSYISAGSGTSGIPDNSGSSSSSGFCNMGYFLSSSSGSSTMNDPNPAYFTYQEDIHSLHCNSQGLHLSLRPSATSCWVYESLRREPQSPDSGFGFGKEDEESNEGAKAVDDEEGDAVEHCQTSPLLILPLPFPSQMCPSAAPPAPPGAPNLTQGSPDSQQVDTLAVVPSSSYAAWPVAGAMCRSSSMPVETSKPGYLTLKELQTTFSNKSI